MSINNDIITALSELDVPVFPDFYDSKIDRYDKNGNKLQRLTEWMTFNNVSDTPSMFADDEDIFSESLFDIHFYSPNGKTAVEMKKKIKKRLPSPPNPRPTPSVKPVMSSSKAFRNSKNALPIPKSTCSPSSLRSLNTSPMPTSRKASTPSMKMENASLRSIPPFCRITATR